MTTTQESLFRTSDPPTSKWAAESVDVNGREAECIQALRWLVTAGSTFDIQRVLAEYGIGRDRNCISRRLTSLERKGKVLRSGWMVGPYGRQVTLWRLS